MVQVHITMVSRVGKHGFMESVLKDTPYNLDVLSHHSFWLFLSVWMLSVYTRLGIQVDPPVSPAATPGSLLGAPLLPSGFPHGLGDHRGLAGPGFSSAT